MELARAHPGKLWATVGCHPTRCGEFEEEGPEQVMAVVVVDPQQLSMDQLTRLKEDLSEFFKTGVGSDAGVTSLFLHLSPARKEAGIPEPSPDLLWGPPVIQVRVIQKYNLF